MPEGHTIHRLARDMRELAGSVVTASSPQGKFGAVERVDGRPLTGTDAHGKHLFLVLDGGDAVHVHLGMRGRWFRYPDPATAPMKQVRLRLASSAVAWDLVAPTRCDLLTADGVAALRSGLGPDPLRDDADSQAVLAALSADPRPVGAALLDQSVLSGVGNVFRNEALHELGVRPARPARSLSTEELERLWAVLERMMRQAVEDGRIVTVDGPDRLSVPEAESRRVYKQDVCRDCGAPVEVGQVGGRTAYWCSVEQPASSAGPVQ